MLALAPIDWTVIEMNAPLGFEEHNEFTLEWVAKLVDRVNDSPHNISLRIAEYAFLEGTPIKLSAEQRVYALADRLSAICELYRGLAPHYAAKQKGFKSNLKDAENACSELLRSLCYNPTGEPRRYDDRLAWVGLEGRTVKRPGVAVWDGLNERLDAVHELRNWIREARTTHKDLVAAAESYDKHGYRLRELVADCFCNFWQRSIGLGDGPFIRFAEPVLSKITGSAKRHAIIKAYKEDKSRGGHATDEGQEVLRRHLKSRARS